MKRTLVAIAAHADDAELNAGGLIAKWSASGGNVQIIMVTNNCSGDIIPADGDETKRRPLPPDETQAIRHREQAAAARLIPADVHYLGYCQRHYWDGQARVSMGFSQAEAARPAIIAAAPPLLTSFYQQEHVRKMAQLLASLQPSLVLTQTPLDIDPEHHAVAALVWQACQLDEAALGAVPLWFWSASTGSPQGLCEPRTEVLEDITPFFERKLQLCAAHASQMTQRRWSIVKQRARICGERAGVQYAEAFAVANRQSSAPWK